MPRAYIDSEDAHILVLLCERSDRSVQATSAASLTRNKAVHLLELGAAKGLRMQAERVEA